MDKNLEINTSCDPNSHLKSIISSKKMMSFSNFEIRKELLFKQTSKNNDVEFYLESKKRQAEFFYLFFVNSIKFSKKTEIIYNNQKLNAFQLEKKLYDETLLFLEGSLF